MNIWTPRSIGWQQAVCATLALVGVFFIAIGPASAASMVVAAEKAAAASTSSSSSDDASSVAKELAPLTVEERSALIGRMTDAQARDLLLYYLSETAPAAATAGGSTTAASWIETVRSKGTAIRDNLSTILSRSDDLFSEYIGHMNEKLGITVGAGGLWFVARYLLLFVMVGGLVEFVYRYLTRGMVARYEAAPVDTVREKLTRALGQLVHGLGAIGCFVAGYVGIFLLFWTGGDIARRDFVIVVLLAILITRVSVAVVRFVFLPNHPRWRIMPVDDEAAAHFVRGTRRQLILGTALLLFGTLGKMWGVDHDVWRLGALVSAIIFTASVCVFLWRYRRHMLNAFEAAIGDRRVPRWAEGAAGWGWYALAVGYVVVAFAIGTYDLLLGYPFDPLDAVLGFFILFVANPYLTAVVSGILVPEMGAAPENVRPVVYVTDPDDGEVVATTIDAAPSEAGEVPTDAEVEAAVEASPAVMGDRRVLGRVISISVLVVSLATFAAVIGVNVFSTTDEYPIAQFMLRVLLNVGVIALLGYVAWAFIANWIDRKLAEEQALSPMADEHEEGPMMSSGTRLQTILPIIRKFIQISIALIAVMVILASMGVNIAPLIAGAGVIGLAVGFGAQTLVKDLISGLFFLMDDAFRIGEYIEAGSVAGTVEKFNARSLVLRGYLGAVYTVPYGDLGKVTNYSRDWVIMKLRFRVPYDTDIDLVRKIFKKIGQDMMEDEELGPNFIQPFKSQGVIKMDDSAFIVSGKFMTKPNKQWGVRKAVYERVQAAFRQYGIKFAPKRVIVDVPTAEEMEEDDATEDAAEAATAKAARNAAAITTAAAAAAVATEEKT
ncbi:mechanosensitive ion channel domain-containing protein [Microbaculum marinum]|uniref:Mechanosensitive ion channel domain-containing protein n=1 Tax=Microbaculum marinum TaxID=1764581 RepID=A0AAW9RWG0_9HYPH